MPKSTEQQWRSAWKIAEAELRRVNREELANLTDENGTRQATYLGVAEVSPPALDSGLRQWQALMEKARARLSVTEVE